jgi:hypothetical protein
MLHGSLSSDDDPLRPLSWLKLRQAGRPFQTKQLGCGAAKAGAANRARSDKIVPTATFTLAGASLEKCEGINGYASRARHTEFGRVVAACLLAGLVRRDRRRRSYHRRYSQPVIVVLSTKSTLAAA